MSSISGTQHKRTLLTTLVHILQSSALYRKIRVSATEYLVWATLLGISMYLYNMSCFGKEFPSKYNFDIYFVGRYFWRLGETSKFRVVHDEPVLILLVLHAR